MATFKKFEDIEAWQKARELSKLIYKITNNTLLANDNSLKYQMRKSNGSIMDNIAEGFERGGAKEFNQFLSISKGSAGELRSQLYRALDQNYINQPKFNELYELADDIGKMIAGLMNYLAKSNIRGIKYKYNSDKNK